MGSLVIRFTCPKCAKELTAPDECAGTAGRCCGTAFVIPWPEPPKPLLTPREVDYEPEPGEKRSRRSSVEDFVTRRRRKRGGRKTGRYAVLLSLLMLTIVAAVLTGVRWSRPRVQVDSSGNPIAPARTDGSEVLPPPPDLKGDGPDWTDREMLDYLRSRGLPLKMSPCRKGQFYMLTDSDSEANAYVAYADQGILGVLGVVCVKTSSAKVAKEMADQHENGTFAWGRYCFTGSGRTLGLFRQALTGRATVSDGSPDLSYVDVHSRLKAKALGVKMKPFKKDDIEGRLLVLTESEDDALLAARVFGGTIPAGLDQQKARNLILSTVVCTKMKFAVQAEGEASKAPFGTSVFAWGRFVFAALKVDDKTGPAFDQVRSALGAP
jgi:hypothetical protein